MDRVMHIECKRCLESIFCCKKQHQTGQSVRAAFYVHGSKTAACARISACMKWRAA